MRSPPGHTCNMEKLPDDWHCEMMNEHDKRMNLTCDFPEKDAVFYNQHFKKPNLAQGTTSLHIGFNSCVTTPNKMSKDETEKLVQRDAVLKDIVALSSKDSSNVVSKYYFHDVLVAGKDSGKAEKATNQNTHRKLDFQDADCDKKHKEKRRKKKK